MSNLVSKFWGSAHFLKLRSLYETDLLPTLWLGGSWLVNELGIKCHKKARAPVFWTDRVYSITVIPV